MIKIPLTRGKVAVVDEVDLPLVQGYKWRALKGRAGKWYAYTHQPEDHSKGLSMHKLIRPDVPQIDHKNGDGLDNRRENLRPATQSQNQANKEKCRGTSRYKGVCWQKRNKRWLALIRLHGRQMYLGHFRNEDDAGRAYNAAAVECFGEYARLNVIQEDDTPAGRATPERGGGEE